MSKETKNTGAGSKPTPAFLSKADELHAQACLQQQDHYIDPVTGYVVMTSFFLKNRGYCCENQCRHCPYTKEGQNV
jgi:hypothetical protein